MDPLFRVAPVPWIQLDSRLRLGSLLNLRAPYFYVIRIQCYKIAKWNVNFTARLENHVVWSAVVNESSETAKIFTTRFSCFLREKIEFFFSVSPRRILINTHMSFPPMVSFYFVFLYDFYFCLFFFQNSKIFEGSESSFFSNWKFLQLPLVWTERKPVCSLSCHSWTNKNGIIVLLRKPP